MIPEDLPKLKLINLVLIQHVTGELTIRNRTAERIPLVVKFYIHVLALKTNLKEL